LVGKRSERTGSYAAFRELRSGEMEKGEKKEIEGKEKGE
jgi:hypothetical protein